jgi:hypothetical protein
MLSEELLVIRKAWVSSSRSLLLLIDGGYELIAALTLLQRRQTDATVKVPARRLDSRFERAQIERIFSLII